MEKNSVTILNVGHGNSTVINCDYKYAIIDAGSKSSLQSFLSSNTIENIDTLLISHADRDHIEGAIGLLGNENIKIQNIGLNTDSLKNTELWDDFSEVLDDHYKKKKINPIQQVIANQSFPLSDATLKIVAPSLYLSLKGAGGKTRSGQMIDSNSISLFIVLAHNGQNIICLPGDLDELGYSYIPEDLKKELASDYLVFPHHGGKCKGNYLRYYSDLLDNVNPSTIIFSNGRGRFGNPRSDVLNLIKEREQKTEILCTQLLEQCSADIPEENINIFDPIKSKRCAGDISILFGSENKIVQPDLDTYKVFKKSLSTPQCQQE